MAIASFIFWDGFALRGKVCFFVGLGRLWGVVYDWE
jgi:hypothetical protein